MSKKEKCKSGCLWAWSTFTTSVFEYDTAKVVNIKNKKVGLMNRLVQLGIILYIVVYGLIIQKGYQKTGNVVGIVTTKTKGAYEFDDVDKKFMDGCDNYFKSDFLVFDPADYVIPPQEPDSFFVMTNMWITCGQRYGICPESPDVHSSRCTSDDDCPEGYIPIGGNGPNTGTCNETTHTCNVRAWCPTEYENTSITYNEALINASNFTVLIKNSIQYPNLLGDKRKRNLLPVGSDNNYLKNCTFDPSHHNGLYCPIMKLGYIVDNIHHGNFTDLSILGGMVVIEISWNCNLDFYGLDNCDPKYTFKRLDDPLSKGYNFRFARYYVEDGMQTRNLYKAYGILFRVVTIGKAGKFDFTTLVLQIGSMIALLGISVVISDVIVLYVLKKRKYYKENKIQEVKDSDNEFNYEVVTNPLAEDTDQKKDSPYTEYSTSV